MHRDHQRQCYTTQSQGNTQDQVDVEMYAASPPLSLLRFQIETEPLLSDSLDKKLINLVQFLIVKYLKQESFTVAEMLKMFIKEYKDHFPVIFNKACERMEVVFSINVKEVDLTGKTYLLDKALDLTYDGILNVVPNSNPVLNQFLRSPKDYLQTSKMKLLEFFAKINRTNANAFLPWYEEALREEEGRIWAMNSDDDTVDMINSSSSSPTQSETDSPFYV
ncbi:PREDICTED: melanoma-associated antigen B4-like [Chrysochloris asiatica]|uniref:Melanoma-associated antigen B4-like n=1 Tax=Chrysochloris asiatica TaxID=185453 RepID=A0A9B0U7S5_CHRAS|nr:PREDICTED: melanoma-associated antigen B4-like [Chrysochloris asiatica]